MNTKSAKSILCAIFFGVMIVISSCENDKEYDILLETAKSDDTLKKSEKITESNVEKITEKESVQVSDFESVSDGIYVYVTGQVKNPGVYELLKGDRIYKAVELAGGFTKKAARKSINLAKELEDGQHINVMSKSEYNSGLTQDEQILNNTSKEMDSVLINDEISHVQDDSKVALININTATKEELMQLTGIGIIKAEAILTYRKTNGDFQNIEDIKKVPGIKDAAYQKIKNQIEV